MAYFGDLKVCLYQKYFAFMICHLRANLCDA